MKKIALILICQLTTVVAGVSPAFSCTHDPIYVDSDSESIKPKVWQEQLESAKGKVTTRAGGDTSFYLVDYTYIGKIESQPEITTILDELFSDDAVMVVDGWGPNFRILPMNEVEALQGEEWLTSLRADLEATIKVGMELIDLEWIKNGKTYRSLAIADENGMRYDNIGHFVVTEIGVSEPDLFSAPIMNPPRLGPPVITPGISVDYTLSIPRLFVKEWFTEVAWAYGEIKIFGTQQGGVTEITTQQTRTFFHADFGY